MQATPVRMALRIGTSELTWRMTAADTRWYWNLTKHIFRYSHNAEEGIYGEIHTINEGQLVRQLLWKNMAR